MTDIEALSRMEDLLKHPKHWCKQHNALDGQRNPVMPESPEARQWCLLGAFKRVTKYDRLYTFDSSLYQLLVKAAGKPLTAFNDQSDHASVLYLLRTARKEIQ